MRRSHRHTALVGLLPGSGALSASATAAVAQWTASGVVDRYSLRESNSLRPSACDPYRFAVDRQTDRQVDVQTDRQLLL